jgi:P27 family predicted phage terminase small subunit
MARPTKSVTTTTGNFTKTEIKNRMEQEHKLKGKADKIRPSEYLNERQQAVFNYIVDELKVSGILSNLDVFVLDACSIAVDRLQYIESRINEDPSLLMDKQIMTTKEKYTKDLFRTMNELSLSPQSRAKLGNINFQAKENSEDPLLKALKRVK